MKQLEIDNLQKIFGIFEAVKKINFSISENQTVALLGPNGCGKTTTIAMILGLITPTSGTITINNKYLDIDNQFEMKNSYQTVRQN
jgi:ABC-type sugar transport system ATPase subunit